MLRFRNYNVSTIDKKFKMKPRPKGERNFVQTIKSLNADLFERNSYIAELRMKNPHLCKYVLPHDFKPVNHQDFMMSELFNFKDASCGDTWI